MFLTLLASAICPVSESVKQWAAVNTKDELINVPPQKCWPVFRTWMDIYEKFEVGMSNKNVWVD